MSGQGDSPLNQDLFSRPQPGEAPKRDIMNDFPVSQYDLSKLMPARSPSPPKKDLSEKSSNPFSGMAQVGKSNAPKGIRSETNPAPSNAIAASAGRAQFGAGGKGGADANSDTFRAVRGDEPQGPREANRFENLVPLRSGPGAEAEEQSGERSSPIDAQATPANRDTKQLITRKVSAATGLPNTVFRYIRLPVDLCRSLGQKTLGICAKLPKIVANGSAQADRQTTSLEGGDLLLAELRSLSPRLK